MDRPGLARLPCSARSSSVLLVSAICGLVGALVVGNRMAFFSRRDGPLRLRRHLARAHHRRFAMGFTPKSDELQWLAPAHHGGCSAPWSELAIAFVREKTGLASDTVIGVFFAGAIGFGAMLLQAFQARRLFNPEQFLFGGPAFVQPLDLLILAVLCSSSPPSIMVVAVQPVRLRQLQPEPGPVARRDRGS